MYTLLINSEVWVQDRQFATKEDLEDAIVSLLCYCRSSEGKYINTLAIMEYDTFMFYYVTKYDKLYFCSDLQNDFDRKQEVNTWFEGLRERSSKLVATPDIRTISEEEDLIAQEQEAIQTKRYEEYKKLLTNNGKWNNPLE